MKVHLATPHTQWREEPFKTQATRARKYVLESFYYVADWMFPYIAEHWNFMLDSGAFTFMKTAAKGANVDWDDYVRRYAAFITTHGIDLFFELDIDSLVGLAEVKRLRALLESLTGKRCIPVWHRSRGREEWETMCQEYSYVAIGGIVSKEIRREEYGIFTLLLGIASKHGAKVHGLGFTNFEGMSRYPFFSVDSTAWVHGNRSGVLYKFSDGTMQRITAPEGMRLKSREAAMHNFREWVKFQRYAEQHL